MLVSGRSSSSRRDSLVRAIARRITYASVLGLSASASSREAENEVWRARRSRILGNSSVSSVCGLIGIYCIRKIISASFGSTGRTVE